MGQPAELMGDFEGGAAAVGAEGRSGRPLAAVVPLRPATPDAGLLAFPAALLPLLPVPVALDLECQGRRFAVVFDDDDAQRRRGAGEVVLDGADWEVIVEATESDRLRSVDIPAVLAMRQAGPLVASVVLGGAQPDPAAGWSLARVLGRIGALVLRARVLQRPTADLRSAA